ncbi:MAG: amino acid permease [Planctomycetota bacterium]
MSENNGGDAQGAVKPRKFGTFSGVFLPVLLTILGVIMYLRQGWVVGQVGLLGGLIIIAISFAITGFTGLAMSSMTTNIRIGSGGAYSIIAQSLGIEMGGAIGIPLYVSQTLAVVMYIFGFRAGWLWIFPQHPALLVDLGLFLLLFGVAAVSARFAFRVQYLVLAVILVSLISVAVAAGRGSMQHEVTWIADSADGPLRQLLRGDFWKAFAVFFPAATGIMAGANMSGDLEDPRRSIPIGTMSAIAVSLVVYVLLAFWLARSATMEELRENFTVMVDKAAWGPAVLAGLLGATFSSALASLVGAPRVLQALGDHGVLPAGRWLSARTSAGEPRNALRLTAAIVFAALFLRDLNAVAPLITMFFLITYGMINTVVFLEQQLGLVSFRPLLAVPRWVPFLGAVGCLFAMFVVNATFSLVALAVVVVFYAILVRRQLQAPFGDIRSGVFVALAEWAAQHVASLPAAQERGWKPNLLVPVEDPPSLRGEFALLRDIAAPRGSIRILGIRRADTDESAMEQRLQRLAQAFHEDGVYASWTSAEAPSFGQGVIAAMETLGGAFLKPNVAFVSLMPDADEQRRGEVVQIAMRAREERLGAAVFVPHPQAHLGRRASLNLWLPRPGEEWRMSLEPGETDLAILLGYKLKRNWSAALRVMAVAPGEEERPRAQRYLNNLTDLARLPDAQTVVHVGEWNGALEEAPSADLHVFVIGGDAVPAEEMLRRRDTLESSCLFARSAGVENALA